MIDHKAASSMYHAVRHEYNAGMERYGAFNSQHEAWAVLLEETEELHDEAEAFAETVKMILPELWQAVKMDDITPMHKRQLEAIRSAALAVAYECVQVAAMCDKWGLLIESEAKP